MTSPRTQIAPKTDETEKPKAGLSAVQIASGALAAVSSAVLLSFFGVAGTLIGAALASVISTVGASLYTTSLKKTNERLRRVLTREQAAATEPATAPAEPATQVLPARLDPRRAPAKRFEPRWGRVAAYAVGVFVVAMGIVTGIELIGQQPVSALVGGSSSTGTTTLGELTNASSSSDTTPSTPSTPTTTAPATSTADSSPAEPTETTSTDEDDTESASPSATTSSSGSSASSSAASPTRSAGTSSAPTQGAAPTP
ncbi:hypothetical protein [Geodermatophilus sp. URMC 64]